MAQTYPWMAAETGTYVSATPRVDLSGTAVSLGSYPSRTFAQTAADSNTTFDSLDECQVTIVVDANNWAVYEAAVWTDAATDTIGLAGATQLAGQGTISDSASVKVFAGAPTPFVLASLTVEESIIQQEVSADPADPPEGSYVQWMSNGSGLNGDDGDVMMKISASGVTKVVTLVDFSAA